MGTTLGLDRSRPRPNLSCTVCHVGYITDIKVNDGRISRPFLNFIKFTFLRAYPSLKPHILFYSRPNDLAIWHVCQILGILKLIIAESHPFNPFKPGFTLSFSSTTSRELLLQFPTCSG